MYFCSVFRKKNDREKARFLYSANVNLDNSQKELSRKESMISHLDCIRIPYDILQVEFHQQTLST